MRASLVRNVFLVGVVGALGVSYDELSDRVVLLAQELVVREEAEGEGGDDTLIGGAGDNTLIGTGGAATADYGGATTGVVVDLATGVASTNGYGGTDDLIDISTVIGSALADTLIGGSGNTTLIVGAGADTLIGSATGTTTASYETSPDGVTIDLSADVGLGGDAQGDTLSNIRNVIGSAFDDVLAPAVLLAGEERAENHISEENQKLVFDTTLSLVTELGNRFNKPKVRGRIRILGVAAPDEVHNLGLLMLLELLRRTGIAVNVLDAAKSPAEICAFVSRYGPDMVFLSCTTEQSIPAAVELVRALIAESPHLTIIGGGASAVADRAELLEAGAAEVCATRAEVRHVVRLYALRRSGSRPSKNDIAPAFAGLRTIASTSTPAPTNAAAVSPVPTVPAKPS